MIMKAELQEDLPLTEATFLILLSLAPGPKHGYAIMKDVQALSKKRIQLSTGTLYGALKRLLDQGWIERVHEEAGATGTEETGRARKTYALTQVGHRILDAETARLGALLAAARQRTSEAQA